MKNCMRDGCRRAATKKIKFHIHLIDGTMSGDSGFNLYSCDSDATAKEIDHIFNDSTKKTIEDAFSRHGMAAPDWERSYAEWIDIEEVEHV